MLADSKKSPSTLYHGSEYDIMFFYEEWESSGLDFLVMPTVRIYEGFEIFSFLSTRTGMGQGS